MQEIAFDLPGAVRLSGFRSGPGPSQLPPLLLLHGLSSNAYFWRRTAGQLGGHEVVAIDQRSHGRASSPPADHRPATLAADAAHVIEQLAAGPTVVAGHSWGASIALRLAADRPDLVAGLALLDGPVSAWPAEMTWERAQALMQPPLPEHSSLEEAYAERRQRLGEAWDGDLEEFIARGLVEAGGRWRLPLTAEVRLEILDGMFHEDYADLWRRVRGPVLIGFAQRSRLAEHRRAWESEAAAAMPNLQVRWYDSDHDIPLELPGRVATDLRRLALRAGFELVARRVRALEGGWERPAGYGEGGGQVIWTARDVLAHLSSTARALPAMLAPAAPQAEAGSTDVRFDSDRWNAAMIRRRQQASISELKAEHEAATQELDAALRDVDLDAAISGGAAAGRSVEDGMVYMLGHQQGHVQDLERVLAA